MIAKRPHLLIRTAALAIIVGGQWPISAEAQTPPVAVEASGQAAAQAEAIHRTGINALDRGDFAAAEASLAKAWKMRRETLGERHPDTLASLAWYALAISRAGRPAEAVPPFLQVMKLQREVLGDTDKRTLSTLDDYIAVLNRLGRNDEAEALCVEALANLERLGGESNYAALNLMRDYARILVDRDRAAEAEPLFAKVLRLRPEAHAGVMMRGLAHPQTIASTGDYAQVLDALGRIAEAEPYYVEALRLSRETMGETHPETIAHLADYAGMLQSLDRPVEAEKSYIEALGLSREALGEEHPETLSIRTGYATTLESSGRGKEAEAVLTDVLRLRRKSFGDLHPQSRLAAELLTEARLRLPERAASALEPARLMLARSATGEPSGDAEGGETVTHNRLLADAAWARGEDLTSSSGRASLNQRKAAPQDDLAKEAFAALQTSLAGATTRALARSIALRAAGRAGLEAEARERERLLAERQALDREIVGSFDEDGPSADTKRAGLRGEIIRTEEALRAVEQRLKDRAPDYFALILPSALSLPEAQALLGRDEAALMLVPTEFGTHLMLITDQGLLWRRSALNEQDVSAAVRQLLRGFGSDHSAASQSLPDFDLSAAHDLYVGLIAPVSSALVGKKRLYVSAAGSLASLPLGMLVREVSTAAEPGERLRGSRWFADDVAINVVPSLQSLQFIRELRRDGSDIKVLPYLGFGDPVLTDFDEDESPMVADFQTVFAGPAIKRGASGPLANSQALMGLGRIQGTAREIDAQWHAFGSPAKARFLGSEATESRLRGMNLSAGIISIATHGLLAGQLVGNGEPGLVFTPPAISSDDDDGYLTASEISTLRVSADWVLLSACNTASGRDKFADGLSGLARSFFYAGATNLLVSHWLVSDDVAPVMTLRSIELARDDPGSGRAQALQQAMREIRIDPNHPEWAHPFYWAPFSFVGDGGTARAGKTPIAAATR